MQFLVPCAPYDEYSRSSIIYISFTQNYFYRYAATGSGPKKSKRPSYTKSDKNISLACTRLLWPDQSLGSWSFVCLCAQSLLWHLCQQLTGPDLFPNQAREGVQQNHPDWNITSKRPLLFSRQQNIFEVLILPQTLGPANFVQHNLNLWQKMTSFITLRIDFLFCRVVHCIVDLSKNPASYGIINTRLELVSL